MKSRIRNSVFAAGLMAVAGCVDSTTSPRGSVRLDGVTVATVNSNVLALRVIANQHGADSLRVQVVGPGWRDSTPWRPAQGSWDTVTVLGLVPSTSYQLLVEAANGTAVVRSDTLKAATGSLPAALGRVALQVSGDTSVPGLLLTAIGVGSSTWTLVFDHAGRIRWYHTFADSTAGLANAQQQPNGNITVFLGLSRGFEPLFGRFVELAPAGDVERQIITPPPFYTDGHELLMRPGATPSDDRYLLFGYDLRTADLSSRGGAASAQLAGHTIFQLRRDGPVETFWSAWDNFTIAEWTEPGTPSPVADFDHPNAMDVDVDGGWVVSWRNLDQITKIDPLSGRILWRLGGLRNQFTFPGDPLAGFSGQHYVRVLPNGNLLLFDNGTLHQPPESRAVEYRLDPAARTATMVWQFRRTPALYSPTRGSVARTRSGHTLVGYGANGVVTEVDAGGGVVWEGTLTVDGAPTGYYRVLPVASLYRYETP